MLIGSLTFIGSLMLVPMNPVTHGASQPSHEGILFHSWLRKLDLRFLLDWKEYDRTHNFLLKINQTEFRLAHNQKQNCHYDHISSNLKGIVNQVFCVTYGCKLTPATRHYRFCFLFIIIDSVWHSRRQLRTMCHGNHGNTTN